MSASEGPVSRYLNRRLSRPLARVLAPTPLTPNQVSAFACALAGAALPLLAIGRNIEAGVLIQASSVVDGVDGDLARAQGRATAFGGVFDAVLDRYADAAIIGGMAWYAAAREDWPSPLVVGFAALVAALIAPYSRARLDTETPGATPGGAASRDVRLLLLALGAVLGQSWWALVAVAGLGYATVAWRLWRFRAAAR